MVEEKQQVEWGNEKLLKAQQAVDSNQYDLDSWNILLRESTVQPIEKMRPFYENILTAFPTCGKFWKTYIEQEMKGRNFEKVEKNPIKVFKGKAIPWPRGESFSRIFFVEILNPDSLTPIKENSSSSSSSCFPDE